MTASAATKPAEAPDDGLAPAEDSCAAAWCGRPRADHEDRILHRFEEPARKPLPERIVEAHIVTTWTCWNCAAECDVWGVGSGWIECSECGKAAFLR